MPGFKFIIISIDRVLLGKFWRVALSALMLSGLAACSSQECPLTIDQTTVIDKKQLDSTTYYLVKRISGWHDKTIIIELFDKKPEYDNCNENIVMPIIDDSIEMDMQIESFMINLQTKQFEIKYAKMQDASKSAPILLNFK